MLLSWRFQNFLFFANFHSITAAADHYSQGIYDYTGAAIRMYKNMVYSTESKTVL